MSEEWRSIEGWDRYEVSSLGRVRSLHSNPPLIRKLVPHNGYLMVMLKQDGRMKNLTVHSLVARAFIGIRPMGLEVAHSDGKGTNNVASNLSYKTRKENEADKEIHGTRIRGEKFYNAKLTDVQVREIRDLASTGTIQKKDIAEMFGISKQQVSKLTLNQQRRSA